MEIGVIVNSRAKIIRRTGSRILGRYRSIAKGYADIRTPGTIEELEKALAEFKQNSYRYIGIAGGDGTIHLVLTHLIRVYRSDPLPFVFLLKGGTMNLISLSIRQRKDGFQTLQKLIELRQKGVEPEFILRNTLKTEDRYGFLFGAGAIVNFLDAFYGGKEKGLKRNLEVLLQAIYEGIFSKKSSKLFQPLQAEFFLDGRRLPQKEILLVLSGSVDCCGHLGPIQFRPLKGTAECSDSFRTILSAFSPAAVVMNLNKFRKGDILKNSLHTDEAVKNLEIKAGSPFRYTLDGDLYECKGDLSLEIGPKIRFLRI